MSLLPPIAIAFVVLTTGVVLASGVLEKLVSQSSAAPPVPPGPWDNLQATWSGIDVAEGLGIDCSAFLNVSAGLGIKNCSNEQGWYAIQVNASSSSVALTYEINGEMVCYAGVQPGVAPNPYSLWQGFEFIRNTTFMRRRVSEFRIVAGRYYAPLFVDRATNNPLLFGQGIMTNVHQLVTSWQPNSVAANAPELAWPKACDPSAPSSKKKLTASSRLEFAGVEGDLAEMFGIRLPEVTPSVIAELATTAYARLPPRHTDIADLAALASMGLPANADNTPYATSVRNQGRCGACWAFSTTALTEVIANKAKGALSNRTAAEWLSPQSKIDCVHGNLNGTAVIDSKGCSGGWPLAALEDTVANGIATEATYPFAFTTGRRCLRHEAGVELVRPLGSAFALPPLNATVMMAAVSLYGGVVAIINPPLSWAFYPGHGIFNDPTCQPGLEHAILIVGYGTDATTGLDYWIIKNSFGAAWSEAGYIRMARGVNMCGIEQFPFGARPVQTSV